MPVSPVESWTVIGEDGAPVEPVERYLAYLTAIERSPNTIRAYAFDLKDYWVFLRQRGLDWQEVRLEDVGEYVAWLQLPPAGRQARWRCCRRWNRTSRRPRSTGSWRPQRRSTSIRPGTASMSAGS